MAEKNQKTDFDEGKIAEATQPLDTRISDLEIKTSNLGKCYSAERYEQFQEAVEKIVLRTLESNDGEEKIKKHVESYFKMKIVWGVLIWLITLIATAFIQKYFKIFG